MLKGEEEVDANFRKMLKGWKKVDANFRTLLEGGKKVDANLRKILEGGRRWIQSVLRRIEKHSKRSSVNRPDEH